MAAASGLDKFRFVDTDLSKLDTEGSPPPPNNTGDNNSHHAKNHNLNQENSQPNAAAAAAAAAAASRLLSLQRDLGTGNPMDFLKQLEASNRNRGGFDRLMSLAGFGFPGLPGLPPLAPLNPDLELKSTSEDRLTPINENSRGGELHIFVRDVFYYSTKMCYHLVFDGSTIRRLYSSVCYTHLICEKKYTRIAKRTVGAESVRHP